MAKKIVQLQTVNTQTGQPIDDVDVKTSAKCVTFDNGKTFEQMLADGTLKGAKGDKGEPGVPGVQGARGDKGDPGDNIKIGASLQDSTEVKLFFKVVG